MMETRKSFTKMSIHKYWWGTVTNIKVLVFAWAKAIYENGVFCYEQNHFDEWKYIQTTTKKKREMMTTVNKKISFLLDLTLKLTSSILHIFLFLFKMGPLLSKCFPWVKSYNNSNNNNNNKMLFVKK